MSINKDYIGNYYQAIKKYKDSINLQAIEQNINTIVDFVRIADSAPTELLNFRDKSKLLGEEAYKYDVFEKAHVVLCIGDWDITTIGSGSICGHVADAMAYTGNLVNRRFAVPDFLNKLKTTDKQKLEKYEMALYEIYRGYDEEKAFKDAVSCFGGKYPLIAFLFFIKDKDRFLPTSPDTFDEIFKEMGIGFKMSLKCSWENYCNFIAVISCVKDYISKSGLCEHEVSLLDAHSAVWIMNYDDFKTWHVSIYDINTPMKPKAVIPKSNGIIKYLCPRCNIEFEKAERCPECGQAVKE